VMEHPSLILGSSQRLAEVDVAACHAASVTIHRRRSGGTAVYSDATLLSLDVALPSGHRLLPANITEAYRWFGEVWQIALQTLGITSYVLPDAEARMINGSLDPKVRQVCFGGVSPYEVLVAGRKLVGLAQIRRRPGGLLQAGIYTRWQPGRISRLLAGTPDERRIRAELLADRACGLDQVGGAGTPCADLMLAWEQALATHTGIELYDGDWTDSERAAIAEVEERYAALPATE